MGEELDKKACELLKPENKKKIHFIIILHFEII